MKIMPLPEVVTRLRLHLLVSSALWAAAFPVGLISLDSWLRSTAESSDEWLMIKSVSASASSHRPFEDDAPSPSDPLATLRDAVARAQLELGKIYEKEGRLADAEAAYVKALETESDATRLRALESLSRVIHLQKESLWAKAMRAVLAPLRTGLLTSLLAIGTLLVALRGLLWAFKPWARSRGTGRLEITSFADSTERKLGSNFERILSNVHAQMRIHYERRGVMPIPMGGGVKLPVVVGGETVELTELVSGAAPESATRAIAWLLRRLSQPEYSVLGSIQGDGARINIMITLERMGRPFRTWDQVFAPGALFDAQKDLAYELLLLLKRRMNP